MRRKYPLVIFLLLLSISGIGIESLAPTVRPSITSPSQTTTHTHTHQFSQLPILVVPPPKATKTGIMEAIRAGEFPLPADAPFVNVKDLGAKGDGVTDDTAAIKAAIAKTFNAWETVYFPPGVYVVSDTISWQRFLTVRGAGPTKTVIRLKNDAPGFNDPSRKKGVLLCRFGGTSTGHDNVSHSNHILNLGVEIGSGNRGAVGIDFQSNNGGGIENVLIADQAGTASTGISLEREANGPAHFNHIEIRGFARGISVEWGVYASSFEFIKLLNQRETGIYSNQHPVTIRKLFSRNAVPAISLFNGRNYGHMIVLDSVLEGFPGRSAGITGDGELFVRNTQITGYTTAVQNLAARLPTGTIDEYSSSPIVDSVTQATVRSLSLPVLEEPEIPWESNQSQWANVTSFGSPQNDDWSQAIQAAIDSGKSTVYFPSKTHMNYSISRDVIVRGEVKRLVGQFARLEGTGKLVFENTTPVVAEQVNANYLINGTGIVTIKRALGGVVVNNPSAQVVVEDICCSPIVVNGGGIWLRSLNQESDEGPAKVVNNGGTLWVLNLKTELINKVVLNTSGGLTEILGGLIYPAQGTPVTPMIENQGGKVLMYSRDDIAALYPVTIRQGGKDIVINDQLGARVFSMQ